MTKNKYDNLSKFMINLAQDPTQLHAFKTQPATLLAQANLNPEEQAIVLARDPGTLSKALKPNSPESAVVFIIRVAEL